jgi:hypothetical protein
MLRIEKRCRRGVNPAAAVRANGVRRSGRVTAL